MTLGDVDYAANYLIKKKGKKYMINIFLNDKGKVENIHDSLRKIINDTIHDLSIELLEEINKKL